MTVRAKRERELTIHRMTESGSAETERSTDRSNQPTRRRRRCDSRLPAISPPRPLPFASSFHLLSLLLLLLLSPLSTNALSLSSGHDSYLSPTELYICYSALGDADTNGDAQVDRDEYLQFALGMIPSDMPITDDQSSLVAYSDLPLSLQAAFLSTACLCGNDSNDFSTASTSTTSACCLGTNAYIRVPAQPPLTSSSTTADESYLYAVCSITMSAIQSEYLQHQNNGGNAPTPTTPPPTRAPTVAPSRRVDNMPVTSAMTLYPSAAPSTTSVETVSVTTTVAYTIALPAAVTAETTKRRETAMADLQLAVDQLAQAVIGSVTVGSGSSKRRQRRLGETIETADSVLVRRRHLQNEDQGITVQLPTELGPVTDQECALDSTWKEPKYVCQDVTSSIVLLNVPSADAAAVKNEFEDAMLKSINGGRLQALLEMTNPDTPIHVIVNNNPGQDNTKPAETQPPEDSEKKGVSTAGIIAASIMSFLVVVPAALFLLTRNKNRDEKRSSSIDKELYAVAPSDRDEGDDDIRHMGYDDDDDEQPTTATMTSSSERVMTNTSSDTTASPLLAHRRSLQERTSSSSSSSSSSAASSGDQSPVGETEPVTTSRESYGYTEAAAVGAGTISSSSVSTSQSDNSTHVSPTSSSGGLPHVTLSTSTIDVVTFSSAFGEDIQLSTSSETVEETRHRLDHALQVHDWAAVGDAAAILAVRSEQEDPTYADKSVGTQKRYAIQSVKSNATVDSSKVKQLDNLVVKHDWDGLVDLAARFEAEEYERRSSRGSDADSTSGSRTSGSVSGSEADSQTGGSASQSDAGSQNGTSVSGSGVGMSASGSYDQTHVSAETRAQVIALVRRVVPEESDNVDEMLQQFRGREEELIETLRSMQERSVAQRAREAKQKAAKAEARQLMKAKRAGDGDAGLPLVLRSDRGLPAVTSALTTSPINSLDENDGNLDDILGEHSALSDRPRDASEYESRTTSDSVSTHTKALERAIESGDWQAVAEVAALLSELPAAGNDLSSPVSRLSTLATEKNLFSDNKEHSHDHLDPDRLRELDELIVAGDWTGVIEASQRYCQEDDDPIELGRSKEEEEALQQAALWETIAEKSKMGAADDAGAVDAAEWAIRRSLSQLKEREELKSRSGEDRASDNEV